MKPEIQIRFYSHHGKNCTSKFSVLKNITFLSEPLVSLVCFVYLEEHSSLY
jgi:hypothetical protein